MGDLYRVFYNLFFAFLLHNVLFYNDKSLFTRQGAFFSEILWRKKKVKGKLFFKVCFFGLRELLNFMNQKGIMEFSPRTAELTTLLESRISNFYTNFQLDEIGRVVSVGDGIARVYGLKEIQAGEMVEFASGVIRNSLESWEWECRNCCLW